MSERGKQLKYGILLSYGGVFLGIISGIVYNPWMIKTIGDSDYGLYTLAMSLINTLLMDFGLSMASQRYVTKYLAENDQKAANSVVGLIFKLYIFISAIMGLVFIGIFFFLDGMYTKLTPEELEKFRVLYVMVATYSVIHFPFVPLHGILASYEKFIPMKITDLADKILTVVLTAAALLMGSGVYALAGVKIASGFTVVAMRLYYIKKYTPLTADFTYKDSKMVRELFSFSVWTSVYSVVMRLFLSLAPSVLGATAGTTEIAVFGYAVSIEGYVYMFVNAINGFFMPKISVLSHNNDMDEGRHKILELMVSVGRFILILFALIFIGFMAMGKEFIYLLVGEEYEASYYCVLLICGYGVVSYPQQIANTYTIVNNKVKERAIISIAAMVAYALIVYPLSYYFGAVGASVAIFTALSLQTLMMNIMYKKALGINVFEFFKKCHLKLVPGFLVFGMISWLITKIPVYGWIGFAVKTGLITVVYTGIVWFFLLNKEEKGMVMKRIK